MAFWNPLNLFRPQTPEEAQKSGLKLKAPDWSSYVSNTIGGIGYSAKFALRGILSAPTHLLMGTSALVRRTLEAPGKYLLNPVDRMLDRYHERMHKVLAFGGE